MKNLIASELNSNDAEFWFRKKEKKFLHNVDTFYYSIKLDQDFTVDSKDKNVLEFRQSMKIYDTLDFGDVKDLFIPDVNERLVVRQFGFAGFYKYCFEMPEEFDIFFADKVPKSEGGESVTSEIIVQIRSYLLWTLGPVKAFERSFELVKGLISMFGFTIREVKENRCDYCYHSNYLKNPSKYFRIDNFVDMQVSRFKRVQYQYQLKPCDEYENDYIALGKRSDKVFVRIYLKSKEVVEQNYKPWFFKVWFFNDLITRYDLYLYEKMFEMKSWNKLPYVRLQFYSEYGQNEELKKRCNEILDNPDSASIETVIKLAEELTPEITLITNVEFQTTRKSTKSYCLKELKDNEIHGVAKRIYDFFDNHKLITEYLTHSTLRLVDRTTDVNKSRCDYTEFWKALRRTKLIDCTSVPKYLKLVREYNRSLNKEKVKTRMLNAAITFSIYSKGMNDDDVIDDCAAALIRLNDNDIQKMKKFKKKKKKLLSSKELSGQIEDMAEAQREFMWYMVSRDGEIYEESE